MEHRNLGRTGFEISVLGFGAWAIGGDRNASGNLGPADDEQSVAAIHHAIDLGVNWIDTAPGYGAGHAEEVVAKALRGLSDRPLVFTKCGFVWNSDLIMRNRIDPPSLRLEIEASLRRLRIETIDLYQIHWVEPENDGLIEEAWQTLVKFKEEGKVAHIGVSNFDVAQLERVRAIAPVETVQPSYSLLERGVERAILPYCAGHAIGVLVYSPLQTGLLTGAMTVDRVASMPADDARRSDPNFAEPRLSANLARATLLDVLARAWGATAAQVAIAWTLRESVVAGAIVGFRNSQQVDSVINGSLPRLDVDMAAAIEAIGW